MVLEPQANVVVSISDVCIEFENLKTIAFGLWFLLPGGGFRVCFESKPKFVLERSHKHGFYSRWLFQLFKGALTQPPGAPRHLRDSNVL